MTKKAKEKKKKAKRRWFIGWFVGRLVRFPIPTVSIFPISCATCISAQGNRKRIFYGHSKDIEKKNSYLVRKFEKKAFRKEESEKERKK